MEGPRQCPESKKKERAFKFQLTVQILCSKLRMATWKKCKNKTAVANSGLVNVVGKVPSAVVVRKFKLFVDSNSPPSTNIQLLKVGG
ncbi:hypothetical protein PTKIN_Ptkin03bG0251000 [Pterospermum kingtungense]